MATRLYNIVRFTGIGAGATALLPHSLNINNYAAIPDRLEANSTDFSVSADATNVSVTNNGVTAADVDVWAEVLYSPQRAFGASGTTDLVPKPFTLSAQSGSGSASFGLNVRDFGAVGDGVTDDAPAFAAAIAAVPDAVNSGNSRTYQMRTIYVPNPPVSYRLATEVELPSTKNLRFMGEGANGSRITSDVNYAFFVRADASLFKNRGFEGLFFDTCGVRIEDQSRNHHRFQRCFFQDTPDYAIKIQSAGQVLDASGGVVGGLIFACEFEHCAGAIQVQGDQSDNWIAMGCQFTRSTMADVQIYSAGWRVLHNAFEQRPNADFAQPYINLAGDSISDILVMGNRFGNEIGALSGGTQPPREAIVLGTIGASETGVMLDIKIIGNYFRGRAGGGPTPTSANAAIRLNRGVSFCQIKDNYFFPYDSTLVQIAHANADDGSGNVFEVPNIASSVAGVNAHTPFFSPHTPGTGQLGSWQWRGVDLNEEGIDRLVPDADDIDGSASWVKTNCTVAADINDYLGRPNVGYTLTKSGAGDADITRAIDSPDGRPVVFSARFRYVTASDITLVRMYANNSTQTLLSAQSAATYKLKPYWERVWFVIYPDSGDSVSLVIALGEDGSADTGDVEMCDVRVEYGTIPSQAVVPLSTAVVLTSAASVTPDGAHGLNSTFDLELANANVQLENMTNVRVGQVVNFNMSQDGAGSRALTFGTAYKFSSGAPALPTGSNEEYLISGVVRAVDANNTATNISCSRTDALS